MISVAKVSALKVLYGLGFGCGTKIYSTAAAATRDRRFFALNMFIRVKQNRNKLKSTRAVI
jgi:hypothetical protein